MKTVDEDIARETKEAIDTNGVNSLVVNDLTTADLEHVAWSGNPLHVKAIEQALRRIAKGEVEYLAVRSPSGWPVALGGIDYARDKDAGTLWQLATHGELQSRGIGTRLINTAESRIQKRHLKWAKVDVETENVRAQKLYLRLGYKIWGYGHDSWDEMRPDGTINTYHTEVAHMKKRLPDPMLAKR